MVNRVVIGTGMVMFILAGCSKNDTQPPASQPAPAAAKPTDNSPQIAEHWESLGGGSYADLKPDKRFYLAVAGLPDVAGTYTLDGNIVTVISTTGEPHRWSIDEYGHLIVPLPTGVTLAFKVMQPAGAPAAALPLPSQALAVPPAPPPQAVVVLNKDTVIDALKRSSIDTLPVFLKISDASYEVVNSVDTQRTIKGTVAIEFTEDTFMPSRTLTFNTPSTNFNIQLLKPLHRKGETVALSFDARINLATQPLTIAMPPLDDYGKEIAKFRHSYPEGGEVAVKAASMIDAATDAATKAQLVQRKWEFLNLIKDGLANADAFQAFKNRSNYGHDEIVQAFDDIDLGKRWWNAVIQGPDNSLQGQYAAHKQLIQPRVDQLYPTIEKIITDAKEKASACSDYLLGL